MTLVKEITITKGKSMKTLIITFTIAMSFIMEATEARKRRGQVKYSCSYSSTSCTHNRCQLYNYHPVPIAPNDFFSPARGDITLTTIEYGIEDSFSENQCQCTNTFVCSPKPKKPERNDVILANSMNCDEVKVLEKGVLCALRPSVTDRRIDDGNGKAGFGHHVIGIPSSLNANTQVHVHFTGTYGKPYRPMSNEFASETFLKDGLSKGRLMIQLAYDNEESVNFVCNDYGRRIDNCAGKIRENKLKGTSPFKLSSTSRVDAVKFRLEALESYLKIKRVVPHQNSLDFSNLEVSGHSQGGGMALYIAYQNKVKRACLIAGGYDSPDRINLRGQHIADWMKGNRKTPSRLIHGIVHVKDPYFNGFRGAFDFLNLYKIGQGHNITNRRLTNSSGERITNYHGAPLGAVELSTLRKEACFK